MSIVIMQAADAAPLVQDSIFQLIF
jgi:hypothetical protein